MANYTAVINRLLATCGVLERENMKRRQTSVAHEQRIADLELDLSKVMADHDDLVAALRHAQGEVTALKDVYSERAHAHARSENHANPDKPRKEHEKFVPIDLGDGYQIRKVFQGFQLFLDDREVGVKGTQDHCRALKERHANPVKAEPEAV